MGDGLRVLINDQSCQLMSDCTMNRGIADLFVVSLHMQQEEDSGEQDNEAEIEDELDNVKLEDCEEMNCRQLNAKDYVLDHV